MMSQASPPLNSEETNRGMSYAPRSDETILTDPKRQPITVTKRERSMIKAQRPAVIWLTGLSGAGKSTIGNLAERKLLARGAHTILLDGDSLRSGLNEDLGFTSLDRRENIRRVGEVAKLMTEAGLIVICALISPFRAERLVVRRLFEPGDFIEVFVDTPLEACVERDPKGLYKRALARQIENFTGLHQPYEPPERPELILRTLDGSPDQMADRLIEIVQPFVSSF
ncbi:MAG: adenylyl-sulfate kinase [Alphaproteobacteria bacterium]|nr:adenylyl-sulfate kinase [Alphaproteobacteria bacterium]